MQLSSAEMEVEAQPSGSRAEPAAETLTSQPASANLDEQAEAPGTGPQAAPQALHTQPAGSAVAAELLSMGAQRAEPQAAQLALPFQGSIPGEGTAEAYAPQQCSRETQGAAVGAIDEAAGASGPKASSSEAHVAVAPLTAAPACAAAAAATQPWPLGYYYQDAWGNTQVCSSLPQEALVPLRSR